MKLKHIKRGILNRAKIQVRQRCSSLGCEKYIKRYACLVVLKWLSHHKNLVRLLNQPEQLNAKGKKQTDK